MPAEYSEKKKNKVVVKEVGSTLIARKLYKFIPYEILQRYLVDHERLMILNEAHAGIIGGHHSGKPTT